MKTGIAYLTMLCCYVYCIDDSKKQNNDDVQHIQTYAYKYDELGRHERHDHDRPVVQPDGYNGPVLFY